MAGDTAHGRQGAAALYALRVRLAAGVLALALGLLVPVPHAVAEIYRWVDEQGNLHFTQDLRQVPADQRPGAEVDAQAGPEASRIQVYDAPAARQRGSANGADGGGLAGAAPIHRIRVQRAGNSMQVSVRINDQLDVPFVIDTGATDVVIPSWAAEQLDLDLSGARTGIYGTANGVIKQKIVRLRSVDLQGARVENVPATVSETMSEGLLGLSYFNHFEYNVDPVAGLVTLKRNQLEENGILRGGRSQMQWSQQFAIARKRIEMATRMRDEVPFGRTRKREALDQEVARLERELALLEREADEARVPFSWRD